MMKAFAILLVAALVCSAYAASFTRLPYPMRDFNGQDRQHTGYIETNKNNGAKLFYWFVESRNNPATDPLVLWMTGGPGCSGDLALLMENGPYHVDEHLNLYQNPFSWNTNASVIFIDQPYGVGFSYVDNDDQYIGDEDAVGKEMYSFMQEFLKKFTFVQNAPFFVTGESYGGHYVPATAYAMFEGNVQNPYAHHINIKGIAIGNGLVSAQHQMRGYPDFAYDHQLIDRSTYEELSDQSSKCEQYLQNGDLEDGYETCMNIPGVIEEANPDMNVYDITKECNPKPLCYNMTGIIDYLNLASTQEALGVPHHIKWSPCNMEVHAHFTIDWVQSMEPRIAHMLKGGVRVLVYSGDLDFSVNWYGGKYWTSALDWEHQRDFNAVVLKDFIVNGESAGQVRTSNGLSFFRVYNAGHLVPYDKPQQALAMLNSFMFSTEQFS
eukprot:GCRY01000247.1.p1 GENE.GCRY01000247.1~~GCRY01000247.1.p1  ORF type:complete len:449 (-),score=84.59 GCRY01000247.1:99-1409(-)